MSFAARLAAADRAAYEQIAERSRRLAQEQTRQAFYGPSVALIEDPFYAEGMERVKAMQAAGVDSWPLRGFEFGDPFDGHTINPHPPEPPPRISEMQQVLEQGRRAWQEGERQIAELMRANPRLVRVGDEIFEGCSVCYSPTCEGTHMRRPK